MKYILQLLISVILLISCKGNSTNTEKIPLDDEMLTYLSSDLEKDITYLSGYWIQYEDNGDKTHLWISHPYKLNNEKSSSWVLFFLVHEGYVDEEIKYRWLGRTNIYDTKKGFDTYGDKVEFLKLTYFNDEGTTHYNDDLLHIKLRGKKGEKYHQGVQLKYTKYGNQFGNGFKKQTPMGLSVDNFLLDIGFKDGEGDFLKTLSYDD